LSADTQIDLERAIYRPNTAERLGTVLALATTTGKKLTPATLDLAEQAIRDVFPEGADETLTAFRARMS
jgi:hypothetical protein